MAQTSQMLNQVQSSVVKALDMDEVNDEIGAVSQYLSALQFAVSHLSQLLPSLQLPSSSPHSEFPIQDIRRDAPKIFRLAHQCLDRSQTLFNNLVASSSSSSSLSASSILSASSVLSLDSSNSRMYNSMVSPALVMADYFSPSHSSSLTSNPTVFSPPLPSPSPSSPPSASPEPHDPFVEQTLASIKKLKLENNALRRRRTSSSPSKSNGVNSNKNGKEIPVETSLWLIRKISENEAVAQKLQDKLNVYLEQQKQLQSSPSSASAPEVKDIALSNPRSSVPFSQRIEDKLSYLRTTLKNLLSSSSSSSSLPPMQQHQQLEEEEEVAGGDPMQRMEVPSDSARWFTFVRENFPYDWMTEEMRGADRKWAVQVAANREDRGLVEQHISALLKSPRHALYQLIDSFALHVHEKCEQLAQKQMTDVEMEAEIRSLITSIKLLLDALIPVLQQNWGVIFLSDTQTLFYLMKCIEHGINTKICGDIKNLCISQSAEKDEKVSTALMNLRHYPAAHFIKNEKLLNDAVTPDTQFLDVITHLRSISRLPVVESKIGAAAKALHSIIEAATNWQAKPEASRAPEDDRDGEAGEVEIGADDLLPILCYCVIRASCLGASDAEPFAGIRWCSELMLIETWVDDETLNGEGGYALATLCASLEYLGALGSGTK